MRVVPSRVACAVADGKAVAMNHDLDFMPDPLKHIGPLPEEWGKDCIKRPLR